MKLVAAENYLDLSQIAASILLDKVKHTDKLTLGLATGGTPIETYNFLIRDYKKNNTTYKHVTTFNLDEYVGMRAIDSNSYHYYMNDKLFNHLNIPKEQTNIPNGVAEDLQQECVDYDKKIVTWGGIDLQILGLGSNGHIGFNEPGTAVDTGTHIVNLTEETRKANSRYFTSIDEVPTQAITMGITSIMHSKEILLLVSGERKNRALEQLLEGKISPSFPASILREHPKLTIIADRDALKHVKVSVY